MIDAHVDSLPSAQARNPSQEHPGGDIHKSSFAGTRQTSEDSKNIRFADTDLIDHEHPHHTLHPSLPDTSKWQNVRRRMSIKPIGLTKIRVPGHLNYKEIRHRFERQSTFHGISHAALAPNKRWRIFWYTAFWLCFLCLAVQIFFLVIKYLQYAKTVDLDLKFENAPFPSITLCNLNPYKKSAINQNPETKAMIDAYSKRVSTDRSEGIAAALATHLHTRVRRQKRKSRRRKYERRYHQAIAECLCDIDPLTADRKGSCFAAFKGKISVDVSLSPRSLHASKCLCDLDMVSKTLWPCFPYNTWKEKLCIECVDGTGHCPMRFYRGNQKYEDIKEEVDLCLCHKEYNHCVATRDDGVIIEINPSDELDTLNITARTEAQLIKKQEKTTTTTTTEAPQVTQALGYENLTDEIAIVTQAQQNLMFAVGAMTPQQKETMSHPLDELVLKCSFNQKDCDMQKDFTLYYDNTYGNCYTFNHGGASSHRAGANYGLRILLYANVSEYLPTSESVGFRITVHDKHIVPFPDAFGYSAPTGFMSSYGVRMKQFIRLTAPHGHCKEGGEEDPNFIYKGFNYSVEACHRSCAQKVIMEMCKCGDPMFPIPQSTGMRGCHATNAEERDCLRNATLYLSEIYTKDKDGIPGCYCHQPCKETNYEVTYSAARWPSGSAKVMDCNPGDFLCLEKYRKNAAMIQIFYEELNYETLQETPAYTLTSVLADLGGLTGLWIGASVVSLLEIFSLIVFASQAYVRNRKGSIAAPSLNQIRKASRASVQALQKASLSTRLSVQDILSLHSNHSSKSKQSIVIEDLPSPIQEQTDDEETSSASAGTAASCRYLPPGEELPCLCKYDSAGNIRVMKALCPVHGFMVRRNYDYSCSNSDEDGGMENDEVHKEEPYYPEPYIPRRDSSIRKKKHKNKTGGNGQMSEQKASAGSSNEP